MTLMERARSVEQMREREQEARPRLTVEDLRQGVLKRISMEDLMRIVKENPERARSELRAACRQTFVDVRWSELDYDEKRRLVDDLVATVFGFGPIESLLNDETVTEIMINGAAGVYYEREGKIHRSSLAFESDEQVRIMIDRIVGPLGRRIDESSPMVSARLPQGHRMHAIIPPISPDGPVVTIRMFAKRVMTLEEMVERGSFDSSMQTLLDWAVKARKNVVVSGGTGSGKTTLLNALSCRIPHDERILTIEDSAELKFTEHPHVVRLEARQRNAEGTGEVTIRDLVINALRMRPDRIVVGECRGGEALDMLQAMGTGHDGSLTTLHANSTRDVVERMVTLVRYAVDLPVDAIEAQIGNAFDLVVQTSRAASGARYVAEVAEARFDYETRRCQIIPLYRRLPHEEEGVWLSAPSWLHEVEEKRVATAEEVSRWSSVLCADSDQ